MRDRYLVFDLGRGESLIHRKAQQHFKTFVLNLKGEENLTLFKEWRNYIGDSVEDYLTGAYAKDVLLVDGEKIVGFQNSIILSMVTDVDGSVNAKVSYEVTLGDEHPHIRSHHRKRKIKAILERI